MNKQNSVGYRNLFITTNLKFICPALLIIALLSPSLAFAADPAEIVETVTFGPCRGSAFKSAVHQVFHRATREECLAASREFYNEVVISQLDSDNLEANLEVQSECELLVQDYIRQKQDAGLTYIRSNFGGPVMRYVPHGDVSTHVINNNVCPTTLSAPAGVMDITTVIDGSFLSGASTSGPSSPWHDATTHAVAREYADPWYSEVTRDSTGRSALSGEFELTVSTMVTIEASFTLTRLHGPT